MKRLFRRQAAYTESWKCDQIVLADDKKAAEGVEGTSCKIVYQPEESGECGGESAFDSAMDVEEISLDDLNEEEIKDLAVNLWKPSDWCSGGESLPLVFRILNEMTFEEVRQFVKDRLEADKEAVCSLEQVEEGEEET